MESNDESSAMTDERSVEELVAEIELKIDNVDDNAWVIDRDNLLAGEIRAITAALLREKARADGAEKDAKRYSKLRRWMSNVTEGWREVENLAALACYMDWQTFDNALDALPECSVGLCAALSSEQRKEGR
jgi:hypothetical protein